MEIFCAKTDLTSEPSVLVSRHSDRVSGFRLTSPPLRSRGSPRYVGTKKFFGKHRIERGFGGRRGDIPLGRKFLGLNHPPREPTLLTFALPHTY